MWTGAATREGTDPLAGLGPLALGTTGMEPDVPLMAGNGVEVVATGTLSGVRRALSSASASGGSEARNSSSSSSTVW